MKTSELMKRFAPYYKTYWKTMVFDLFCASLTTVCELVLPKILRYITNQGMNGLAAITVHTVLRIGMLYFGLRVIDGLAAFYMAYTGHVMGAKIETDMQGRMPLSICRSCRTAILTIRRSARSWRGSPATCLT